VDDFYIGNVFFFQGSGFGPVTNLDAFAIGIGEDMFRQQWYLLTNA